MAYGNLHDYLSETKDKNGRPLIDTVEPVVGDFLPKEYYPDGFPKDYYQSDIVLVDKVKGKILGTVEVNGSLYHDPSYFEDLINTRPDLREKLDKFAVEQLTPNHRLSHCSPGLSKTVLGDRPPSSATAEDYVKKIQVMNGVSYNPKSDQLKSNGMKMWELKDSDIGNPTGNWRHPYDG